MDKKKLIMNKALELFAERGFNSTSVQEITEGCGISKGAFYLSFKSKDELILALIHEFLQEFISDIDRLVSESDNEQLLYNFYHYYVGRFQDSSGFAQVFMKEQTHFLNEEFFAQITGYNDMIQLSILTMLEKVYGGTIKLTKYDLVYAIQGLMTSYMELLLFSSIPLDANELAKSLVEKTDILAKHTTLPVITPDSYAILREPSEKTITSGKVIEVLDETLTVLDESIEKESLLLLKDLLVRESTFHHAIVVGLMKNIENHPSCKRLSYLLHVLCKAKKWSH